MPAEHGEALNQSASVRKSREELFSIHGVVEAAYDSSRKFWPYTGRTEVCVHAVRLL